MTNIEFDLESKDVEQKVIITYIDPTDDVMIVYWMFGYRIEKALLNQSMVKEYQVRIVDQDRLPLNSDYIILNTKIHPS